MPRSLRPLIVALGAVVTLVLAYLAVRNVDLDVFWDGLTNADYFWLLPSLALLAITVYLRALRWGLLFRPQNRPPRRALVNALLVGYLFNQILPARAGEAARVIVLHQEAGTSRAEALGTAVIERVYDVVALLALLFVAAPFLPELTWLRRAAIFGAFLVLAILTAILLVRRYGARPFRVFLRPLARLPGMSIERTDMAALNLAEGLGALHQPSLAVPAFAVTVLSWLVAGVSYWVVLLGFDLPGGLGASILILIATNLALVIPSLPASIGVFEAATVVALAAYGVSASQALPFAVVLHALNLLPFLAVGLLVLRHHAVVLRRRSRLAASPKIGCDV